MSLSRLKQVLPSLAFGGTILLSLLTLLPGTARTGRLDTDPVFAAPSGTGDCSQAAPCDLQTAVGTVADGGTVYLGQGAYTGTGPAVISLTQSITIFGGWDSMTTVPPLRDADTYPTIIDGEEMRRCIRAEGPASVLIEGLTIAYGTVISTTPTGWDGAGLYARGATLTLRDVNVYSNVVDVYDVEYSQAHGGGVAMNGGTLVAENCAFRWNGAWARSVTFGGGLSISGTVAATVTRSLFQDNDAWHAGGLHFRGDSQSPISIDGCSFIDNGRGHSRGRAYGGYAAALDVRNAKARIVNNTMHGNRVTNDNGALYVADSDLYLTRNVITGNRAGRTSGMDLLNVSTLTVTNNIVADNVSRRHWLELPAVRLRGSTGHFVHNTIAGNDSAYGLEIASGAMVSLTNTILVSHTVGISVTHDSAARLEGTLWGSGPWANVTDWGGAGSIVTGTVNVWGSPHFVDPDGSNYHIGPGSAARDMGIDAGTNNDIDGDARPEGDGPDIGADETGPVWDVYMPSIQRGAP